MILMEGAAHSPAGNFTGRASAETCFTFSYAIQSFLFSHPFVNSLPGEENF